MTKHPHDVTTIIHEAENQNGFTVKNGFIDSYSQIYSFPQNYLNIK
jgi:hypothetical protein